MKLIKTLSIFLVLAFILTACGTAPKTEQTTTTAESTTETTTAPEEASPYPDAVEIRLSDEEITVNGVPAGISDNNIVSTANDIVYYEAGKDFTYGEGSEDDAHTPDEAAEHTVVHINKAGQYIISGKLSAGQIAIDLGKDAKENPDAVVTLILNGADITCKVAPAIIFYNVYECGSTDAETATKDVDTSKAGANVIIADGSVNTLNGSYVARIYKPESVVLNAYGTEVEDAKKLHKYDGALYSKMSMNVNGEEKGSGVLNINAENEGLDTELHLTINGGNINILSGNDGINTNEDEVSVTTVNAGKLNIRVTGETGEGDGIDSNGWLVINGGTVTAFACSTSADAGIDSDMGIHINGGTVLATGSMLDRIEGEGQAFATFNLSRKQGEEKATLYIKDSEENTVADVETENAFSVLVYSSPELDSDETYTLWDTEDQIGEQGDGRGFGGPGGPGDKQPRPW